MYLLSVVSRLKKMRVQGYIYIYDAQHGHFDLPCTFAKCLIVFCQKAHARHQILNESYTSHDVIGIEGVSPNMPAKY